jgi:signal peptidase II
MRGLGRLAVIFGVLVACVGCDQTSKSLARNWLQGHDTLSMFHDTLRIQYVENRGAFLSLGESLPHEWRTLVFTLGVAVVLAAILGYMLRSPMLQRPQVLSLALVCGGGIGNLIDRIRQDGHVTDFINCCC